MNISTQIGSEFFIVDDLIYFSLNSKTFLNVYESTLVYTAYNLPFWLNFDSKSLTFSGVPTIKDLDKNYTIKITATNGFHETSDVFEIRIRYFKPIVFRALSPQVLRNPWAAEETTYFFFKNSFVDPNNGTLSYHRWFLA